MVNKKLLFLGSAFDAASDVLFYDRKNDDELTPEDVNKLINSGEVSLDELVDAFKEGLKEYYNWD